MMAMMMMVVLVLVVLRIRERKQASKARALSRPANLGSILSLEEAMHGIDCRTKHNSPFHFTAIYKAHRQSIISKCLVAGFGQLCPHWKALAGLIARQKQQQQHHQLLHSRSSTSHFLPVMMMMATFMSDRAIEKMSETGENERERDRRNRRHSQE